jgi:hypothetical protein
MAGPWSPLDGIQGPGIHFKTAPRQTVAWLAEAEVDTGRAVKMGGVKWAASNGWR